MTEVTAAGAMPAGGRRWRGPLVLRLALRELRGGLRGFGIFLACLILGVTAIAGVASVSRSLSDGLAREGRRILGGDVAVSLLQRPATPEERRFLDSAGFVAAVANLRAMATGAGGAALVELKAVDGAYPLVGAVETKPEAPLASLLAAHDGTFGAVADPALFARLNLAVGDRVSIGNATIELKAELAGEPDKLSGGVGFGPRLILSQQALAATGLIQPGSLVRWTYQVVLPPARAGDAGLARSIDELEQAFPKAGWQIRSRVSAAPQFERNVERFTQFLTLVGLTALVVGGVGIANAVRGFVERQQPTIATMKSLGAPGRRVVAIYLTQIMIIAALGVLIGLAFGAAFPFVAVALAGSILPIPVQPTLALSELAVAAVYGLLTAFVFAIGPLGRAHDVPVSGLFRDLVAPSRAWPRPVYLAALAVALATLIAVAVGFAYERRIAMIYVAAAAAAFLMLRAVAQGLMALARRLPRPRAFVPRLALANIHRPGALTPSLVLSLGLGVTLLVTLALIDANIRQQLTRTLPAQAPDFYFLDVPSSRAAEFAAFVAREAPSGRFETVPMMRGRLVSLKGIPVDKLSVAQDVAWVLEGDRGITYAAELPEGSRVTAGEWWPSDHAGPPLVSFDAEVARGLGLAVGDAVVVNVLGRDVKATVGNLRTVEWRSLGINFVMVFSPDSFRGAPHTDLATLRLAPGAGAAAEAQVVRAAAQAFPMVSSVRVKDALAAIDDIVSELALAIRGASSIALLASVLVLAGALAAGHRARLYDAVVLKTLGATRARLMAAYALEYGALGLAAAVFGLAAGTLGAAVIVTQVMKLAFVFSWPGPLFAAVLAVVVTVGLGLMGTWRVLGQPPAPHLRNL
ncbi:ABC transporter permease [Chelatococcus reniformis]|uniref:ABC transporter permease n=1 Tax=Chelatococcus reniformis TaxID=1494448 RepID=A0A916TYZ1_9HYPH|nr:FtsX-like permease family protein [Chelatococcus reniformis]GGC50757.1 ABC transporter permease [Chelatococcus reniformis]